MPVPNVASTDCPCRWKAFAFSIPALTPVVASGLMSVSFRLVGGWKVALLFADVDVGELAAEDPALEPEPPERLASRSRAGPRTAALTAVERGNPKRSAPREVLGFDPSSISMESTRRPFFGASGEV